MAGLKFDERPILVFWESTKACLLACRHCRAEAMATPLPGQLSTDEATTFIDSLVTFGRPYPVLIFTGGDVMMRPDLFPLAEHAKSLGIPIGMAPSVTPRLTVDARQKMRDVGVKTVSISLDGASAVTHDRVRGILGHFDQTVSTLRDLVDDGFDVQVNTVVMAENVAELPAVAELLVGIGVKIWEVFFLIQVGRGRGSESVTELPPRSTEDVCHFLYDASKYGMVVRTVEAPFFRRVVMARKAAEEDAGDTNRDTANACSDLRKDATGIEDPSQSNAFSSNPPSSPHDTGALYRLLAEDLALRLGPARSPSRAQTSGTRDGKGIVFVSHDGTVYPAGFLPVPLGNIRETPLSTIYRENPLLQQIRSSAFSGRCGMCEYQDLCGGSRSRAYAHTGDALATDPACLYPA